MATEICRLLPPEVADGFGNMARDEVLLESAVAGCASLRFYGWTEATVSLGYFQPERLRHSDDRISNLPYVRRPTGGATLVHHHELTYALALPAEVLCHNRESWLLRMHRIISAALATLGVPVSLQSLTEGPPAAGALCFQQLTCGDVLLRSAKVVGSAQRKQRGALLQHGAILLARSPYAPALPGIQELSGRTLSFEQTRAAIAREFALRTGWHFVKEIWTSWETEQITRLALGKYSQDAWNRKR
jgi:lipoate-protein ligase A